MVDLVKQDMTYLWAQSGDIVAPDPIKIESGWAVETVPRQWWNWMQNRVDTNVAYALQKGIPEWDATTEYIANKSYVQYLGVIYRAIATSTNAVPSTSPASWVKAFVESTNAVEALKTLSPAANRLPYYTGTNTAALTTLTAFARTILDDPDATTVRATISAQQANTNLTALSDVTAAANALPYFSGTTTMATTTLSSFGRSLIDDANAAAGRTTLGLGTISTQNSNAVSITGGSITGITDLAIADGGTGSSTAAGARTNLGLGTAATAAVQTSTTDTTADRLLSVGAFGLGAGAPPLPSNNYNNAGGFTGFWRNDNSIAAINPPFGATDPSIMLNAAFSTSYGWQLAGRSSGSGASGNPAANRLAFRTKVNNQYEPWVELWHAGNQLSIGTTSAAARAALALANSATITATNANTASTIVQRDGSGNFSAGTITAALSGNASTATALQTARTINGVSFNGTANITVADATKLPLTGGTLTGTVNAPTFNATSVTNGGFQGIDADSATNPSFTWSGDLNTGIWRAGADSIGFTCGGANRVTINTTGIAGNGSQLTSLNASNLATGTVAVARGGTGATSTTGTGNNVLSASPALTGTPTAPTAPAGTNTGQIATTAFVQTAMNSIGGFTESKAQNGYVRMPNGIIVQWGRTGSINTDQTVTITLPTSFTSGTSYSVVANRRQSGASNQYSMWVAEEAAGSFTISNDGQTASAAWIAVGY